MDTMPSETDVTTHFEEFALTPHTLGHVYFAGNLPAPPPLAYQVHFPRIEMVLDGQLVMEVGNNTGEDTRHAMDKGSVLYIPSESWNKPVLTKPVETLSILFGKQSFGISILRWNGENFDKAIKRNVLRRGPRTGAFIIQALEELRWHNQDQQTARLVVASLLSHISEITHSPPEILSKSKALFEAVRAYVEQHYHEALTRETVAQHFYVSPNYLSQLFTKEGKFKFNEYLNHTRLERAKCLLQEYDMKVKEVAHRCGFTDSNYFCRIFRAQTDRSPSEYRAQYRCKMYSATE
ncbi:HTH-type transcriptional activator RhaS [Pseudovibrio axinellae]|uniref:HTH-type transcriptional activator RhaS n=1 Tax=Pseudovibrio axinellae TaxID=989403 RepID=A0A165VZP1_9HYPH|nr:AraC family transcriptional regulator [Pseudovibrio axinellae]KZL15723.1 HTH-type transcriptional activator RhaS [Pseudovibrio axinellae]SER80736.1 Helix-turn-helix domain-containing protein [Pseudovibrio axinellae]